MRSAGPPDTQLDTILLRVFGLGTMTPRRRFAFALLALLVFVAAQACSVTHPARAPRPKARSGGEAKPAAAPAVLPPAIKDEELVGPPELEGPPLPPQEEEMVGPPLPSAGDSAAPAGDAGAATPSAVGEVGAGGQPSARGEALLAALAKEKVAAQPCARGVLIVLPESVFEYGTAELLKASRRTLREIAAAILETTDGVPVSVEGHTDSIEAEMFNQGLSERRARTVAAELAAAGVSSKLLRSEGFGSRMPIAANSRPDGSDDPDGRARNRRVEIVIETENDSRR